MKVSPSPFIAGILILITLPLSVTYAQKEAEIINKLRVALREGAIEKAEPPIACKGNFLWDGLAFTGGLYYHKPNLRMEMTFGGVTFIRVANDTIEWEYNPFEKQHIVRKLDAVEQDRELKKGKLLDFAARPLLTAHKQKNAVKFKGEEKLDSVQVYVLELTVKDSDLSPVTYYINKRTNLIYKAQLGSEARIYANYRIVSNYAYPSYYSFSNTNGQKMEMEYTDIVIGSPIPDSLFTVPQEAYDSQNNHNQTVSSLLAEADSLLDAGAYESAITTYGKVLKLEPNNYRAYNGRGLSKTYIKKYYEAIADLNIALELEPQGSRAFNNRGLAKFQLGDNKGALEDYNEALRLDSTMFVSYKNRGLLHYNSARYADAKADFSKAIVLQPENGDAHFKLGVSVAQLGLYEEALTHYAKATELGIRTEQLYNYRGVAEFKLQQYEGAATSFREANTLNPEYLQYIENLGNALYRLEKYDESLDVFEGYLKKDAKNDGIYNMIGLCKYMDEEYKGAIQSFTKAIELNGNLSVYFENRGDSKQQLDDYEGAILDYTQAITVNPNDAELFYKRGTVKILSSKKLEGCQDLGTAHDMKFEGAKEAIMKNCN